MGNGKENNVFTLNEIHVVVKYLWDAIRVQRLLGSDFFSSL